ncbi:hypothetical protein GCM10023205_52490 [Yinghuangia aomiensis]|uniref:3'-phosphoadenosine 5'-phosphosulfate sulfotransferase (PAPS reductase)/FAD synthetase n=1 Tax=Yinghuangia aomiensis TaxID=676205 RepID=A0ABP9HTA9_9ACTN
MTATPRVLSLGAGVQSTALLLLSAEGVIPRYDAAIFADTGWEPAAVYQHLDRIDRDIAGPAGIPILRVSNGNIRDDALDSGHRFASMPLFVRNPDGTGGLARRQCTNEYKLKPIKAAVRAVLGAKERADGKAGRAPKGRYVHQSIGISTDEFERAKDADVSYARNVFPLLDLGMSRNDCRRYLTAAGLEDTPKSACIGCPFSGNSRWRTMRDEAPKEFADAVAFDHAIRHGGAGANAKGKTLRGTAYLHRSMVPLDKAPIDRVTRGEWKDRQVDLFDAVADQLMEDGDPDGCSPWACRSGAPIDEAK